MFRPVHRLLEKLRQSKARKAKAMLRARQAYDEAKAAYDAAVDRRDTRAKHATSERLTVAATNLLRTEGAR